MISSNRVVVTGMGVVSPCGIGLDAFWDSIINCKSGIAPITRFDASDFPVKIAGEVKNFDMRDYFGPKCRPHRYSNQTQFGLVACQQALDQAGLTLQMLRNNGDSVPVILGAAAPANHLIESNADVLRVKGPDKMPLNVRAYPTSATAGAFSHFFNFPVSATTISSCCPSGLDAVYEGMRIIKDGRADIVLAGGIDSYITQVTVASFHAIRLNSSNCDLEPHEVSRPFDKKHSGVVFAEGAGVFVLERLDSALARGAMPLMEVLSGARATGPLDDKFEGMKKSMDSALKNAGVHPSEVDYICANAPSSPDMDIQEVRVIKEVFGGLASRIPVSSIRGVTGHGLASAGLLQLATCSLAMKHHLIPPTANLTDPDPECDLDHVPLCARNGKVNIAIVNSNGLVAENSTLVVKRV